MCSENKIVKNRILKKHKCWSSKNTDLTKYKRPKCIGTKNLRLTWGCIAHLLRKSTEFLTFIPSTHHSYRISELLVSLLVCHSLFSHFNLRLQICSMKWNQICRDDFFWKRRFRFVRTKVEPFWLGASRWYKS
jgi:hypothetical protein